jgi:chromosome segregation ATPase
MYTAGNIPQDVLMCVPSYVTLSKEHGESSQKIAAISAREIAAQSQVEELRGEQKRQSLQMNSQMQNLKIKCESQVRALMLEMGKLAKYGDELKIQLKMQQRESAKIAEGEMRESALRKTIEVQKAELDRMRSSQLEKLKAGGGDEGDLKKQLTAEIEKLGEAFGKLQNQNADLVKQIKKAKQQVHDKSKDVETNRQRANLSSQNVQAIKAESERRARAEAHTSNYAKAQEAALKKSTLLVEKLRKEKSALARELQALRGNQVRILSFFFEFVVLCLMFGCSCCVCLSNALLLRSYA